jgi:protein gp37
MAKRAKKAVQAPVNPAEAAPPLDYGALVAAIGVAHQTAQSHAVQAVNVALTLRNWLIGYHLFEYEQHGSDRAQYGERLLDHLAGDLRRRLGRGFGKRYLEMFRQFYLRYPIAKTVFSQLGTEPPFPASISMPALQWQDGTYFQKLLTRAGDVNDSRRVSMSENSSIEWTDSTWNPVRGCTKITPGCDHCYAETFAERFRGVPGHPYEQGFDLRLVPEKLAEPVRWKTPKMIFVNSMSDLFHKDVPDDYVEAVCRVMERANWHTYQVLTKRSSRLRNMLQGRLAFAAGLRHIWWGVSVEDRAHGLPRIEHLREAPAAVRMLSVEPLLEDLGEVNLAGMHWMILGGESGHGARPMHKEWVISLRDQCARAGVPFFFKQWGGVRKSKAGRELDGRTYDKVPGRLQMPVLEPRERLAAIREFEERYLPSAADCKSHGSEPPA